MIEGGGPVGGGGLCRALLISGAALALLAAVACSSSGKASKTPAPGGTATASQARADATSTPVTGDAGTAVAAKGAVEMVDYTDKDGRYTVKLPRGWTIETNTNVLTATLAGDPVSATLGIFCLPGADIPKIEAFDQQIMQSTNAGVIPFNNAAPTKVGALDAQQIPFTGGIAGVPLDRVFVYFVGHGCAWRIQMTAWPGITLEELKPILNTMKSSFAFTG